MVTDGRQAMLKRGHHYKLRAGLFYGLSWGATLFFLCWVSFVLEQARQYSSDIRAPRDVAVGEIAMCALYMLWATWLVFRDLKPGKPMGVLTAEQRGALMRLSLLVFVLLNILLSTFLSFAFFASVD